MVDNLAITKIREGILQVVDTRDAMQSGKIGACDGEWLLGLEARL